MTQLTALQLSNVGVLIGLLIAVPDANYDHFRFGGPKMDDCNPARPEDSCALGHALRRYGKFRLPLAESKRTVIQRLLGITTTKPTAELAGCPRGFGREVFGDGLDTYVFAPDAFGCSPSDVTKNMVLDRLFKVKAAGGIPAAA